MNEPRRRGRVLLVGFQDQDNLGLRYLLSSVRKAGFEGRIETYETDPRPIVELARRLQPDVIGLSLIFQYMAPDFGRIVAALRQSGCRAHITLGGHYPSFDYAEALERIPGADSIVRFEGELTLVELMQRLEDGADWRDVSGVAWRDGARIVANPLRPALDDLDQLPCPERSDIDYLGQDLPTASVLGSRGCPWDCSFCSIRPFYEAQGGKLRRLRAPQAVVEEMRALHDERGVKVFLFQDDDFLATGRRARQWAEAIADGIAKAGLQGRIAFKISCRADEVKADTMSALVRAGLTHVYMGVENGDEDGLKHMNKMMQPHHPIEAGEILRAVGLSFDFGFMLLEPYSTLQTVRNNIEFLDRFVGDGWTVASFCRTLPYAGTPLKAQLEAEGRLLGTPFEPDYNFLDPKLDRFYDWILLTFRERNFTNTGLAETLKSLLFEARLNLPGYRTWTGAERARLHALTAQANGHALYALRAALDHIEASPLQRIDIQGGFLGRITEHERAHEQRLLGEILDLYATVRRRLGLGLPGPGGSAGVGGFENAWTLAPSDLLALA
jgi:radical SAM superfamily enzyme YgiQ (UPF0313 family)